MCWILDAHQGPIAAPPAPKRTKVLDSKHTASKMAAAPSMELDPKYDNYDFPTTAPTPQNGHPGHLTKEQQAAVYQLRMLLEAEGCTKRLDTLTLVCFPRCGLAIDEC